MNTEPASMSELVARAQAGDREAFEALAESAYDRLYAVACRILRNGHDAEDAVQEALIRAWRDLRSLRDRERFEAWLYRLLIHACHDQGRRRRRLRAEVTALEVDPSDPADVFAGADQRDELERAFLRLPVEHRAVIILTHYLGMSATEVGRALGIPQGTVYSRLHYGLRMMRATLADPARTELLEGAK